MLDQPKKKPAKKKVQSPKVIYVQEIDKNSSQNPKKETENVYKCCACGYEYRKQQNLFFKTKSTIFRSNNYFYPVCKKCIQGPIYSQLLNLFENDDYIVVRFLCNLLDIYYDEYYVDIAKRKSVESKDIFGKYLVTLNLSKSSGSKRYVENVQNDIIYNISENHENDASNLNKNLEIEFSETDEKNKELVLSKFTSDPFKNYDPDYKKYLYNMAAEYLNDDIIVDNPHKMQAVIEIVKLFHQADMAEKIIISEYKKKEAMIPDTIEKFTKVKNDCIQKANNTAKENGISSSFTNKNQGLGSFAYIIKEMEEYGFENSEINMYDIKTCESFKQFADISNRSIIEQIRLNKDDFGDMFETQRAEMKEAIEKSEKLEEQNRILKFILSENNIDYNI